MDEPKNKGGRPPKPDEDRLVLRAIRLKPAHWAKVDAAGMEELRKLIDRWRPKPKE